MSAAYFLSSNSAVRNISTRFYQGVPLTCFRPAENLQTTNRVIPNFGLHSSKYNEMVLFRLEIFICLCIGS